MDDSKFGEHGTSMVELMLVVIVLLVLMAIAIPSINTMKKYYRISGDARDISAALNLARMRAAADFTHTRVYMNLGTNTFHVEVWNKGSSCWQTDGDSNSCTRSSSPVIPFSTGDTFGYGSITAGPTTATSSISQPSACTAGVAGASPGSTTTNTACIEFNSRGYPVNSSNSIIASDAAYITNGTGYAAIAVSISGQPATYRYVGGTTWAQF
jgi:Tfp pilus assembly protein FimT